MCMYRYGVVKSLANMKKRSEVKVFAPKDLTNLLGRLLYYSNFCITVSKYMTSRT